MTKEVLAQDDEFAARLLDHGDEAVTAAVRQSEFSPEVEALHAVIDRLGEVITGLVALGGGRPGPVPAMPRPQTAIDRVREQRRRERHYDLVSRIVRR